jgi:hypothetical protein
MPRFVAAVAWGVEQPSGTTGMDVQKRFVIVCNKLGMMDLGGGQPN